MSEMKSNRQMLFLPYDGYIVRSIVQNVCARSCSVRQQNATAFRTTRKTSRSPMMMIIKHLLSSMVVKRGEREKRERRESADDNASGYVAFAFVYRSTYLIFESCFSSLSLFAARLLFLRARLFTRRVLELFFSKYFFSITYSRLPFD